MFTLNQNRGLTVFHDAVNNAASSICLLVLQSSYHVEADNCPAGISLSQIWLGNHGTLVSDVNAGTIGAASYSVLNTKACCRRDLQTSTLSATQDRQLSNAINYIGRTPHYSSAARSTIHVIKTADDNAGRAELTGRDCFAKGRSALLPADAANR